MLSNNYIGIPFEYKGRTTTGLDCWGLVRLIYKDEYDITLPSFSDEYEDNQVERIGDLISQYKEGWESIAEPEEGSLVLFRVMGVEAHVGIAISSTHFIHAREGFSSAIEAFDSPSWKKRIVGHFKYSEKSNAILNVVPHPLRTERFTMPIPQGIKLDELVTYILKEYNIDDELKSEAHITVNGIAIHKDKWQETVLNESDKIEYRSVPTGSAGRMLAVLAIAIAAPWAVTYMMGGAMTAAGVAAAAAASPIMFAVGTVAINMLGSALVNAIAPVRPPSAPADPGSSERQLMLDGAQNQVSKYGAIPVVLGKVKITPPLGAVNYLTYENERDSYVSMLLTWGYGPLSIDESTLKIGEIPLSNFTNVTKITLDRKTEPTTQEKRNFDAIYGKDITQVNTNVELTCDGNPETTTSRSESGETQYFIEQNLSRMSQGFFGYIVGQQVTVTFTVPSGISGWNLSLNRASNIVVTDINLTTKKVVFSIDAVGPFDNTSIYFDKSGGNYPGTFVAVTTAVAPGPWYEAASTETVDSFTMAINFPSGLRRIVIKGDGSGNNQKSPTSFRVEYFYNSTWYFLDSFTLGDDAPKRDAFTFTKTYSIVAGQLPLNNGLIMRIRRETGDNTEDNPTYRYYHTSVLQNVAFSRNAAPAVDPVGSKIAKTAFKIKATDQLNGSIAGVNAIVQTYCKAWNGTAWVDASTSNPAALFRYVLEHSGNSQRITSPSTKFDLVQLQYWSNYCTTKGFEYNSVLATQRSILEVLRDICAAGRASPALIDGKWTVIIDEPKSNVIQHFTPHNSWDFESTKALPKMPDGLRVNYFDEAQDYQEAEYIVYNAGKDKDNATLFESIQLPGVTKLSSVIDHAKWHFAQAKLRPEVYTLNADIEYLVCNRGDRVKVMHDVPMWGIGSGRIKNRLSSTSFELDEELPLELGKVYTFRVRSSNGSSVTRTITAVVASGYYTQISVTASTTEAEVSAGDLFMFGEVNSEANDLIVLNIEPTSNKAARLTLVDYGVNSTYNIFNDYLSLTSDIGFQSNITLPARLLVESFGERIPTVTKLVSDESVMELIAPGVFKYNLAVSYVNAPLLPKTTSFVEVQWDYAAATDGLNQRSALVAYEKGLISVPDISEGEIYKIRLRYISTESRVGLWTDWVNHTIVGKTNPPSDVINFTVSPDFTTGNLNLKWDINPEIDINTYEVRTEDTNWGVSNTSLIFSGTANTCIAKPAALGITRTFYVRAIDFGRNYSLASASIPYIVAAPSTYSGTVTYSYADTSTTDSTTTLKWTDAAAGVFAINKYEVTITKPGPVTLVQQITGLTWTTTANWVGNATVTIKSIDILGNKSVAASTGVTLSKARPNAPASGVFTVADAQVYLDWADVTKTSLPVGGYEIRKNNSTWGVNDANFVWRGSVSNAALKNLVANGNVFYINTFDTDNVYGTTGTTLTYTVQRPAIVTGLTGVFSDTSTTNALVKFDWIAPAITTFGIKKYIATLTKPGGNVVNASLDSTTWTVNADWVGTATLSITTVDMLDFTSTINAILNVNKLAPNQVGSVSSTVSINDITVSWTPLAKTTLPIAGYEIRANDTGWGTSSGLTWRGSTNTTSIGSLSTGSNIFYIRAFDTEGIYSTSSRSFDLAVTAPLASTLNSTIYANTSTSGTTIAFNWTGNKGTFNISSYNLTLTKPGSIVTTASISANTWTTSADWIGDATLQIVAVDSSGNTGATLSSVVGKTRPTAPTTVTTTTSPTGLTIAWNEGVKGSLPIAGYELRATGSTPGGTDYIWKGTASSVTISNLILGSNTRDLWAFDTDLRYSAIARPVSYTAVSPSNPQTLSGIFNTSITNSLAEFKWVKPSTSVFGIDRYEVSLTTTDPVRTINSTRLTTDWAVPADWLGNATLSVTAYDNLGFASNAVTFILAKLVPSQPGAFSAPSIKGNSLSLDWPDTIKTSLPIVGYELRSSDSNWGGTGFIWKGSSSSTLVDMVGVQSGTTSSWYLKAYDSDNRYSPSRLYQYTVQAPVNTSSLTYQFVDTSLTSATVALRWLDTEAVFGLKHYEITGTLSVLTTTTAGSNLLTLSSTKGILINDTISSNSNIPVGCKVTQILSSTQLYIDNGAGVTAGTLVPTSYSDINYANSTSITQDADWLGNKNYTIKTVDLIGNKSTGTSTSITKAIPNAASNLKAQVIDNTVLLYWDLPQITSLPISHVLIKKGASWNTASNIGTKSGTFTTVTEIQGGVYTYWIAVIDTDNNESVPISLTSTVSQPPDYVFNAEWISNFTGTKSNAIIEANTGYLVLPVNTSETFTSHFTTRSWATPDNQIAAGFPIYIQPGATTGYYEEVFDYSTTLGSSQITVSLSGVNIAGSPDVAVTISTSSDDITYTSFPAGTSAFAINFRYIKVRITATQVTSGNIYSISGLVVRLDAKQKTDSGTSILSIGGSHAQASLTPDYYTWVAGMTMPPSGYQLIGDTSESAIVSATGPSGSNENIWACVDTDIALGNDGGFYTNYSTIDSTKGHLFAVFVKTTTNNGITYFGTSTDSTILTLGGVVTSNPYFWNGDLPALNTWYLLVGYIYPSGYGTSDGGISGIYNLSGTKLVSATSYKFNAGAIAALQRCFHDGNPTGTGTEVQYMARPVVIQCDAADATSKISYLLKCINDYGATVVPNIDYLDVTSITTTPNSISPTTTVVDFYDKFYPTRFNIFNYNSAGVNVGGKISWTIRGY